MKYLNIAALIASVMAACMLCGPAQAGWISASLAWGFIVYRDWAK